LLIVLLKGKDRSRLLAYDIEGGYLAWEEIVNDNFPHETEPILINNVVYLISNRMNYDLESSIYAYGASTGIPMFIKEFPRSKNTKKIIKIINEYNNITTDSTSILVFSLSRNRSTGINEKAIIKIDANNGNVKWETKLNDFPTLSNLSINLWEDREDKYIILKGDKDLYTINIESGNIVAEKRFDVSFSLGDWGYNTMQFDDNKLTLWDPMGEKVWKYEADSKFYNYDLIKLNAEGLLDNNEVVPTAIVGSKNGVLRAFNMDGGWLGWNVLRWSAITGASTSRVWVNSLRAFCLTEKDSLFTFDIMSGKKINSIKLDHHNYSRYFRNKSNEVMILANDEFIIGVDPLNGGQLWKIKESRGENIMRTIRPLDNNVVVTRAIEEDSIIIINNYNRVSGNMLWSNVLDRSMEMSEPHFELAVLMGFEGGLKGGRHAALFSFIQKIDDSVFLITSNSVQKIDITTQHNIEPSAIKLNLARAYHKNHAISNAIDEYEDLVDRLDQMNKDGHKELAELYMQSNLNEKAAGSLVNYYNLLMPGSKATFVAINALKEITPLAWVKNIMWSDEERFLFADNSKIYHLSKKFVEIYRAGSGALIHSINLDDNVSSIVQASAEQKHSILMVTQTDSIFFDESVIGVSDTLNFDEWRLDNSKYNLVSINKSSGKILYDHTLPISPLHTMAGFSINNDNILIGSIFEDSLSVWCQKIEDGNNLWNRSFLISPFYRQNKLDFVFYKNLVIVPLDDKLVYLDRNDGSTIDEFIDEDIEEIVAINSLSLIDNKLTFIIENVDYEYITLDLDDDNAIVGRGEFVSENPNLSAVLDDCFIEIHSNGYVAAHCFSKNSGALNNVWKNNLNVATNYLGAQNGNLVLLDRRNNAIVKLNSKTGKQMKDVAPLLWKSVQENMINNRIILQSENKLYVYNL